MSLKASSGLNLLISTREDMSTEASTKVSMSSMVRMVVRSFSGSMEEQVSQFSSALRGSFEVDWMSEGLGREVR